MPGARSGAPRGGRHDQDVHGKRGLELIGTGREIKALIKTVHIIGAM